MFFGEFTTNLVEERAEGLQDSLQEELKLAKAAEVGCFTWTKKNCGLGRYHCSNL